MGQELPNALLFQCSQTEINFSLFLSLSWVEDRTLKTIELVARVISTPMTLVLQNTLPLGSEEIFVRVYDYKQYQIWD